MLKKVKFNKFLTVSIMLALLLTPFAGDVITPWILSAAVAVGAFAAAVMMGKKETIFARMKYHQEYVMLAGAVLSVGMALLCRRGAFGAGYTGEVFVYLGIFALLFYAMRGQTAIRIAQYDLFFYAGSLFLTLYFVSYAIAPSMLLVPVCVLENQKLTSALGVMTVLLAMWGFCREKYRIRQVMYCAGAAVALLVLVCNCEPGMLLIALLAMYAFILEIPPNAEYLKRCLGMFCAAGFLLCNLSLLVNYTKLIRLKGFHYPLEISVMAELMLSVFVLYVVSLWDKLGAGEKSGGDGLIEFKRRLQRLLKMMGKVFAVCLIFGGIHLWVGLDNFMTLFWREKWITMQKGVVATAWINMTVRMGEILRSFWTGNVLALCRREAGILGFLLAALLMAWVIRQVWLSAKRERNVKLVLVMCGVVLALMLLTSAAVELFPLYAVWLDILICDLQPKPRRR